MYGEGAWGAGMRAPYVRSLINFLVGKGASKRFEVFDKASCSSKGLVQEANDEVPF